MRPIPSPTRARALSALRQVLLNAIRVFGVHAYTTPMFYAAALIIAVVIALALDLFLWLAKDE